MTAIQVRKLLSDIAALQKRLQTRTGVTFRGPFEADAKEAAEPLDTDLPDEHNAACVITTVYEARPNAKREPDPNSAGASRKKSRR